MSEKTNFPLCLHNEEFVRHLERNLLRQVNELVLTQSLISYSPCLISVTVVFSLSFSYIPCTFNESKKSIQTLAITWMSWLQEPFDFCCIHMQAQEAFKFNMITTYSLLCIKIFLLHFKLLKEFPSCVFQLSILFWQITKRHKVKKTCLCYMRNSQSHSQSWLLHKKDK